MTTVAVSIKLRREGNPTRLGNVVFAEKLPRVERPPRRAKLPRRERRDTSANIVEVRGKKCREAEHARGSRVRECNPAGSTVATKEVVAAA